MKNNFFNKQLNAGVEGAGGAEGFSEKQSNELKIALKTVQDALETKQTDKIKTAVAEHMQTINDSLADLRKKGEEKTANDIENQKALDGVIAQLKELNKTKDQRGEVKTFTEAFAEMVKSDEYKDRMNDLERGQLKQFKIPLIGFDPRSEDAAKSGEKAVGVVTTGATYFNGGRMETYRPGGPAMKPSPRINMRDLISSEYSPTGDYVSFEEIDGEQSAAPWKQVENTEKRQLDLRFAKVLHIQNYIAGYVTYTKQAQKVTNFLDQAIPRFLLREFYFAENSYLYNKLLGVGAGTVAAIGANTISTETNDIKQLIDYMAYQRDEDYMVDAVLTSHRGLANLAKFMLDSNQAFSGLGGVVSSSEGGVNIMGNRIFPASFTKNKDKFLMFDGDYVTRIEGEAVNIEFSREHDKNFTNNLITARIECFEELAVTMKRAVLTGDFGNSAIS